jgi:AraC-like DNA-binding protein
VLAEGHPVTRVSVDVGYSTASAFIAMFKSVLGTTPNRFFARS